MSNRECRNGVRVPGAICGSPTAGLCERVAVEVKKLYDAAMRQVSREDVTLALTAYEPPAPTPPLAFTGGRSVTAVGAVSNLSVTCLTGTGQAARVRCDVTVPVEIEYTDALGVPGRARGTLSVHNDVVLCVPAQSVMPYTIEASISVICPTGEIDGDTATVSACITEVLKVVVRADIVIPTYGYLQIPAAVPFNAEACGSFFGLPLFPG
ncbi:MAG: hypothetical protein LBM78_03755 [Clostridiales bacterium]|jgi:hypothetical protein|nr:hypothetical protein [Clostridiales bacterium]